MSALTYNKCLQYLCCRKLFMRGTRRCDDEDECAIACEQTQCHDHGSVIPARRIRDAYPHPHTESDRGPREGQEDYDQRKCQLSQLDNFFWMCHD